MRNAEWSEASHAWHLFAAVSEPRPSAIVVRCSDPRLQAAFEQFIKLELGLAVGQSIPIVIGGGAGVLGHPEQLPKEFKFLKERIENYCLRYPTVQRIVLINHEGCRYYEWVENKTMGLLGPHFGTAPSQPRDDLVVVARNIGPLLAALGRSVEFYYAKFTDLERNHIEIERTLVPSA
jgi:hypothetical protein